MKVLTGHDGGLMAEKVFRYSGITYLSTLPLLVIWTLATQV